MQTTTRKIMGKVILLLALVAAVHFAGAVATGMYLDIDKIERAAVWWLLFGGLIVLLVVIGWIVSHVMVRCGDRHCLVRGAVVVAAIGFLVYLRWDCAPPAKVYTWADVEQPSRQCAESRAAQMPITKLVLTNGTPMSDAVRSMLGTSMTNSVVLSCKTDIEAAWNGSTNYRAVLATLDTFDEIACITTNISAPILNFLELRRMAQLHWLYAQLKTVEGDPGEGVKHLAHLYSVARKALPCSGILVEKMIWIAVAGGTLSAASQIALETNTPPEVLRAIRKEFPPLQQRDVSLRNVMIGELACYNWFIGVMQANIGAPSLFLWSSEKEAVPSVAKVFTPYLLNPNAAMREAWQVMEPVIAGLSKMPMECPDVGPVLERRIERVRVKNAMGAYVLSVFLPNCMEAARKANRLKVRSDLLAVYLGKRLGEPVELNDLWTGKPYLVDETTGTPYSLGAEKTQTDLKMPEPWK